MDILHACASQCRDWLFDQAFPLWWEVGADHLRGGFHEKIDQTGRPTQDPRRIRVQARQVFVYAEAGRLGWSGPWEAAIRHGLAILEQAYRRPDGFYRTTVTPDGAVFDDGVDLYDQAFVLLALAHAFERLGRPAALLERASGLLTLLVARLGHPLGGFEEAVPQRLPLRSNPHMHMLEALLAWTALDVGGLFQERATDVARLAATRLIEADTGSIGEYYDGAWMPAPGPAGLEREPGHQFEWAFLLHQAGSLLGIDTRGLPERLRAFGEAHGVASTGAAIFSVSNSGKVIDGTARLWAQTERLRTSLVFGDQSAAERSAEVTARFLATDIPGLWLDRMLESGEILSAPAPASSLYHIVTAYSTLMTYAGSP